MKIYSFDVLIRLLSWAPSGSTTRRGLTRFLGGLAVGGSFAMWGAIAGEAKPKKKRCGPCKRRKNGKCKPKATGTACMGGTCQSGACIQSALPPAAVLTEIVCPGPERARFFGPRRLAQTFVANGTGAITRAEVEFGFIPEGTDLLFEIRTVDAAGVPTNVVLANTERNDLPAGDRGTRVSATFNSAAKVTANTAYALVLTNVSADVLVVNARNGDCGGPLFGSVQGSDTFVPQLALNLIFSVGP